MTRESHLIEHITVLYTRANHAAVTATFALDPIVILRNATEALSKFEDGNTYVCVLPKWKFN